MKSLISKSEFSQQFPFLYIVVILVPLFTYLSLLVILYYLVLSSILVSRDRVILFVCFFVCILRKVKCSKYIFIST